MTCNVRGHAAILGLACAILLAACAASVETQPARFVAAPGADLTLARSTEVRLPTRYTRVLAEGSRWRKVGSVQQGEVYSAVGTVFTIEGRQVHEAYLILSPEHSLVGFYLPGESNVSMLPQPIPLTVKDSPR